ncbi:MAG: hypothetical protein HYT39_02135 [Candidatus Sungbacteria bacterium]|nr:hypothetical protein [Candidatus Sungbacteria bacterium]
MHNSWREELLPEIVRRLRGMWPDLVRVEEVPTVGEAVCHFKNGPPVELILREDGEDVVIYFRGELAVRFRNPYLTFMDRLTR